MSQPGRSVGRRRSPGFTLVEVVVALAVLSLVVLTLGATLRGLAQSSERVDRKVDAIDSRNVRTSSIRFRSSTFPGKVTLSISRKSRSA